MDVQKEREAFEEWVARNIADGKSMSWEDWCWKAWQEAKAKAVPEGFVLVPKEPAKDTLIEIASVCIGDDFENLDESRELYQAMIEAQVSNQTPQFNLEEFLIMEEKLKSKGGVIVADLDRFIAYAEMVLEKAKALKEPK